MRPRARCSIGKAWLQNGCPIRVLGCGIMASRASRRRSRASRRSLFSVFALRAPGMNCFSGIGCCTDARRGTCDAASGRRLGGKNLRMVFGTLAGSLGDYWSLALDSWRRIGSGCGADACRRYCAAVRYCGGTGNFIELLIGTILAALALMAAGPMEQAEAVARESQGRSPRLWTALRHYAPNWRVGADAIFWLWAFSCCSGSVSWPLVPICVKCCGMRWYAAGRVCKLRGGVCFTNEQITL